METLPEVQIFMIFIEKCNSLLINLNDFLKFEVHFILSFIVLRQFRHKTLAAVFAFTLRSRRELFNT